MAFFENATDIDKDTFSDVNLKNKNANPLPLFADGSMPNCFYSGTARVILTFDNTSVGGGAGQRFDLDGVGQFGSGAAFDIFNSITEYEAGALVEASDGEYYRSLQNNNTGNDPTSSPTFWEQVNFIRTYNVNVTYGIDAIVIASNGLIFRSLQAANLNNDPLTSPLFWGTPVAFVDLNILGDLSFAATELTISSGSVAAETSHHTIDTEAAAASDDLDTITVAGVADFTVLYLRLEDAARVVTLKDNTGNIQTKNNEDIILDANIPTILFRVGTDWFEVQRPVVDNPFDQSLNKADNVNFAVVTATTLNAGTLIMAAGSITDSSGTITFDNDNLTSTGAMTFTGGGTLTGTWVDLGTILTVNIDGGTIDGVPIGVTTPSSIRGTTGVFSGKLTSQSFFNVGADVELTIATGAVTVTQTFHRIDTESDDATDDLVTINGGSDGDILILRSTNVARVVTVKKGSTIALASDFVMTDPRDRLMLQFDAGIAAWAELSRSNNPP